MMPRYTYLIRVELSDGSREDIFALLQEGA